MNKFKVAVHAIDNEKCKSIKFEVGGKVTVKTSGINHERKFVF